MLIYVLLIRVVLMNFRIPSLLKRVASTISHKMTILSSFVMDVLVYKSNPVNSSTTE
jgi:hypothetical protein